MNSKLKKELIRAQVNEITEHYIYKMLSKAIKGNNNKKILQKISNDELKHYNIWKKFTGEDPKPNKLKIRWYYFISRIFGLTFGVKLMEQGEKDAQVNYSEISKKLKEANIVMKDEEAHEKALINILEEEKLSYIGSVVLGLNDALVELTGALAGFTLALQNAHLIAVMGLITGIAASLSMAGSEYLSIKTEDNGKRPLRASVYTGVAYIFTVIILISPFFIMHNIYLALGWTILNALIIILFFTFYVSIAKGVSFKKKFLEMAAISLGVAAITFIIGYLIRTYMGVEI
ncbi:MAG: VIT1/CCC1 transporter family protein [Candidatus Woesearchaeota archaeon]